MTEANTGTASSFETSTSSEGDELVAGGGWGGLSASLGNGGGVLETVLDRGI